MRLTVKKVALMDSWILVATALVIFMSIPGVALFYGGLVSSKNVVSVLTQSIALVGVVTITLLVAGNAIMGSGFNITAISDGFMLLGAGQEGLESTIFGFTFAIITPILILGGFAERVKLPFVFIFSALWTLVVYCPFAYWVWGQPDDSLLTLAGTFGHAYDWAGGIVVHQAAGVAALVLAIVIGSRKGFGKSVPHNPTMVFLGASVLWVGWFGFNAGLNDGLANAGHMIMNTHVAAATAALVWPLFEAIRGGKPTLVGAATGAVAGLVAITPACHEVAAAGAFILGIAAGIIPQLAVGLVKSTLKIDDSLDVFAVHGVAGIVGTLLMPFLMFGAANSGAAVVFIDQLAAVVISLIYNVIVTAILAYVLKFTIGMRVDDATEEEGLDITAHGERGYNL